MAFEMEFGSYPIPREAESKNPPPNDRAHWESVSLHQVSNWSDEIVERESKNIKNYRMDWLTDGHLGPLYQYHPT